MQNIIWHCNNCKIEIPTIHLTNIKTEKTCFDYLQYTKYKNIK